MPKAKFLSFPGGYTTGVWEVGCSYPSGCPCTWLLSARQCQRLLQPTPVPQFLLQKFHDLAAEAQPGSSGQSVQRLEAKVCTFAPPGPPLHTPPGNRQAWDSPTCTPHLSFQEKHMASDQEKLCEISYLALQEVGKVVPPALAVPAPVVPLERSYGLRNHSSKPFFNDPGDGWKVQFKKCL